MLGLGKRVGSTRINRYERLASLCDMETAAAIARVLDVPLPFLFAETDDMAQMILAFDLLSKADRTKVLSEATKRVAPKAKSR